MYMPNCLSLNYPLSYARWRKTILVLRKVLLLVPEEDSDVSMRMKTYRMTSPRTVPLCKSKSILRRLKCFVIIIIKESFGLLPIFGTALWTSGLSNNYVQRFKLSKSTAKHFRTTLVGKVPKDCAWKPAKMQMPVQADFWNEIWQFEI